MAIKRFMFATGIKNSYPVIQLPDGTSFRVDEMEKCGHYGRWQQDFNLVKAMGIKFLRYGPPYYQVHTGPGSYDWDFADQAFQLLQQLGITPIVDLCHFGVPDWLGNFQKSEWPHYYLLDNGLSRQEYEWFMQQSTRKNCVMGNDYYVSDEHMVHHDGTTSAAGDVFGYYAITRQYFGRYRLPIMHTETNMAEPDAKFKLFYNPCL